MNESTTRNGTRWRNQRESKKEPFKSCEEVSGRDKRMDEKAT